MDFKMPKVLGCFLNMKRFMVVSMLVVLGVAGIFAIGNTKSPESSPAPDRRPSAILAKVPVNAPDNVFRSILKSDKGPIMSVYVSPNKKLLCYSVYNDTKWEWGIMDPQNPDGAIKYSGSSANGFGMLGMVWSPQSDEVAIGLGYRVAWSRHGYEEIIERWVRIGVSQVNDDIAKSCNEMAAKDPKELNLKPNRVGWPVWGSDGRYYITAFHARKEGITVFQSGHARAVNKPASRFPFRFYDGRQDHDVLIDNITKLAHVFEGKRHIESFQVAAQRVQGWWFLTKPEMGLFAAHGFRVIDGSKEKTPAAPVEYENRWVGIDMGKGLIAILWDMDAGVLIQISRDLHSSEVVFIDTRKAAQAARMNLIDQKNK